MPARSVNFTQENYFFILQHMEGNNFSKTVNEIIDAYREHREAVESMLDKELYKKLMDYLQRENQRRQKNKSPILSFRDFINDAVREKLERELAKELFL